VSGFRIFFRNKRATIIRTVGVVHQFLTKPCDPDTLKAILIQTAALQDMLPDGVLKNLISQLGKMPSLPSLYAKLQKIIAKGIAAQQSENALLISNTFLVGTLHDFGKLVLLSSLPDQYQQVIQLAREQNITNLEAELTVFGVSQSAVGANLLGLWGFNGPILEGICFFHQLEKYPTDSFNPALAVHVANYLYYRNRPNEIIGKATELVTVHRYTSKDCITRICNRSSSASGSFKQASEL
jgi:hypothetical protein